MRRMLMLMAVIAAVALPAGPARAGAACPEGFADRAGDTVRMVDNCFNPTVLRVEPGTTVRFVNADPAPHTVGGAAGSFGEAHADIAGGKAVSYRFDDEGVFPYFCIIHPGMTGAIVVGDGLGPAVTSAAVPASEDAGEVARADRPSTAGDEGSATPVVAAAFGGAGLGAGAVALIRRRRRAGRAAEPRG